MGGPGRPFQKGQVANPYGRPKKGKSLTEALERLGNKRDAVSKYDPLKKITRKERLAEELWELALVQGDIAAIKYIYDRVDGRPDVTQTITGVQFPKVITYDLSDSEPDSQADPEDSKAD